MPVADPYEGVCMSARAMLTMPLAGRGYPIDEEMNLLAPELAKDEEEEIESQPSKSGATAHR